MAEAKASLLGHELNTSLSYRLVHGDRVVLHNGAALPARGRGLGGDEQAREEGRGVVKAREGSHTGGVGV